MLTVLPEDVCRHLSLFLLAPEVLDFLIVHRRLAALGTTERFWTCLLSRDASTEGDSTQTWQAQKRAYLQYAYTARLSTVKWRPLLQTPSVPSAREGHCMILLKSTLVVMGGFCNDNRIHTLSLGSNQQQPWTVPRTQETPSFVYGASLTAIDDNRAVRFGGFRAGGYSGETNEVCLLTMQETPQGKSFTWERKTVSGTPAMARAYHTATLMEGRYLVILGGMTTSRSIMDEAVLDTQTWTWLESPLINTDKPSGRHGHSVVLDSKRNRLVLFGGGSGSDLLRSGVDNAQVWQLEIGSFVDMESPWRWTQLYRDDGTEEQDNDGTVRTSDLSQVERLCLGRCHLGVKVSTDMVLFAFGSGHPTTNGVLAYDLSNDTFHRSRVQGPLPVPRFTAAAAVWDGWLIGHGGYTTQVDGTRADTILLDLAPGMKRPFPALPILADDDRRALTYRAIQDADVQQEAANLNNNIPGMLLELAEANRDERRTLAANMLANMIARGGTGGRAAMILSMVANGTAVIGESDEEEIEEDNDEEEEEQGEDSDTS